MKNNKKMLTDYYTAAHWCGDGLVLVNNIGEIDPNFYDENADLFVENEFGDYPDYYQFFITNWSSSDVDYLRRTFDLKIGYTPLLDCFVLFVDHYGTTWKGVPCEVKSAEWWEANGEKYGYKDQSHNGKGLGLSGPLRGWII